MRRCGSYPILIVAATVAGVGIGVVLLVGARIAAR
jgi:hypothetical protein